MTEKTVEIIPFTNEQDWLELRSKNVSSTESSALYGLNKYVTEFELWHQKKAGGVHAIADNPRMAAGRALEPAIAKLAADELGIAAHPFKDYMYKPKSRMGSSFDFMLDNGAILEVKNVDYLVYRNEWIEDMPPSHIEVQVQHQMHVSGAKECYIAALVGGNDLKLIRIEYNPKMGEAIEKRIIKFWEDVEAGTEPKPDWERDAEFVIEMNSFAGAETIQADEEVESLVAEYGDIKRQTKELEDKSKEYKAKILSLIGDAGIVVSPVFKVTATRTKDTEPKFIHITEDMVGTDYQVSSGRKGYRQFRVNFK